MSGPGECQLWLAFRRALRTCVSSRGNFGGYLHTVQLMLLGLSGPSELFWPCSLQESIDEGQLVTRSACLEAADDIVLALGIAVLYVLKWYWNSRLFFTGKTRKFEFYSA